MPDPSSVHTVVQPTYSMHPNYVYVTDDDHEEIRAGDESESGMGLEAGKVVDTIQNRART